jgi:hypothetical protein
MNATQLISRIRAKGIRLKVAGNTLRYEAPAGALTDELKVELKAQKMEIIKTLANDPSTPDESEGRRQQVLAMLSRQPESTYAFVVEEPPDSDVIVAVGIRHVATFEMHIPQDRYDPIVFLRYLDGIKSRATN